MADDRVWEWLRAGIAAAKADRRDEARELLLRVIAADERNEQAWLWLSGVVDRDEDRLVCLENVLTLNPNSARARAGLRWLQVRGCPADGGQEQVSPTTAVAPAAGSPLAPHTAEEFLTPDGCVYCGRLVDEPARRCPHCGRKLTSRQFEHKERSFHSYLLHAYWILLASVNLADLVILGYAWSHRDQVSSLVARLLPYFAGPVVTGRTEMNVFAETDSLVQATRCLLLGFAVFGGLDAAGLFLRRPRAHSFGLVLIALHLVAGLTLFVLGFLGPLMAAFRALITVMLTIFMISTVPDYSQKELREWLEPDHHLLNDTDYYARGRAYARRGMWAKALLHWRRAAALNPTRDSYFAAMARAYTALGRYEQALAQIDEAVRVSRRPDEWQSLRKVIEQARGRNTLSSR